MSETHFTANTTAAAISVFLQKIFVHVNLRNTAKNDKNIVRFMKKYGRSCVSKSRGKTAIIIFEYE